MDALAARLVAGAGVELEESRFAASFREHTERLFVDARRVGNGYPFVVRGIHEDRLWIARFRVDHRPSVHALPDCLVAVHVALAFNVGAAAEHAVLELALALERLHAALHLGLREIAAAAGAAEL